MLVFIYVLLFTFLLFGCNKKDDQENSGNGVDTSINVSFDTVGGSYIEPLKLAEAGLVEAPLFPLKTNMVFAGWYKESTYENLWDFEEDEADKNLTLYAKWKDDTTNYKETFKVLSIGNSFSEDAHKYLYKIAKSYGVDDENIIIGNVYKGGAELALHVNYLNIDHGGYVYQKYANDNYTELTSQKLSVLIKAEAWDVITFQEASRFSGLIEHYGNHIQTLVEWALENATNENVKIGWHMTWADDSSSPQDHFGANYNSSQENMNNLIIECLKKKVLTTAGVNFIIPTGTAIQNARTSFVGDHLTKDGYHLTDPLGRYIAGLSFYKAITGYNLSLVTFCPSNIADVYKQVAFEAVNNAIFYPLTVTDSTYKE